MQKKAWLNDNRHHSIGLVFLETRELESDYPDVYLTIGDCSRTIQLDFCIAKKSWKGDLRNARRKLRILRNFLDHVERALDQIEARMRG